MPYDASSSEQKALIARVYQRIDELQPEGRTNVAPPAFVYEVLEEAADDVVLAAPRSILHTLATPWAPPIAGCSAEGTGWVIPLPTDRLHRQFITVELSSWQRSVTQLTPNGSSEHVAMLDPYQTADVARPRAVPIVRHIETGGATYPEALHLFPDPRPATVIASGSVEDTSYVTRCSVVRRVAPEAMPDELVRELIYRAASSVLSTLGDADEATAMASQVTPSTERFGA